MRYLFVDINMACNKIDYLLGLYTGRTYDHLCNVRAKLTEYKIQLNKSDHNDQKEVNRIARNFDRFVKKHQIEY
jgi:hypothetical protein